MRKLLLAIAISLGLWSPASAVVQGQYIGNANYTATVNDSLLVATTALTATRTINLPSAGGSCVGQSPRCSPQFIIIDQGGGVGGANACYSVAPASGELINGVSAAQLFCGTYGLMLLIPISGSAWISTIQAGNQIQGTNTNDNAPAGSLGEVITSGLCPGSAATATITVTIATPGVVTWTAHGLIGACPVVFTTTGALPTGITSGTTYYVVPSSITTNTFQIATTVANALAGTAIATSGTQSGTQTGTGGVSMTTTTAATVTGVILTPGDWDCRAFNSHVLGASTSVTILSASINSAPTTVGTRGSGSTILFSTAANVMGVGGDDIDIGAFRVSLAANTNYYLVQQDTFTVSTDVGFGSITCRRAR